MVYVRRPAAITRQCYPTWFIRNATSTRISYFCMGNVHVHHLTARLLTNISDSFLIFLCLTAWGDWQAAKNWNLDTIAVHQTGKPPSQAFIIAHNFTHHLMCCLYLFNVVWFVTETQQQTVRPINATENSKKQTDCFQSHRLLLLRYVFPGCSAVRLVIEGFLELWHYFMIWWITWCHNSTDKGSWVWVLN